MVQVVPEDKSSRSVSEDWLNENRDKFPGIDIDREHQKAKAWCSVKKRQCTRRFFVAWLNRVDPAFYKETARNDVKNEADAIKAKYPKDAMGQLIGITAEDTQRLKELRQEWKEL